MKSRQHGFTLIEISIVLVIIGLLLGGVLKGQELIESARVKNAVSAMNGVSTAYNSYVDRYRALPGDDGPLGTLTARGGPWASVTQAGNVNGTIAITQAQTFTAGGEGNAFWQHLKAAGFMTGNIAATGVAALPVNPFNGVVGVGTGVTPTAGTAVLSVCMSKVPGKNARALDAQLDDGVPNTGAVLATLGAANANTAPGAAATTYDDANIYTVCKPL